MNLETWFKLKHSAYEYERKLGIDEWTGVEKSVLAFIAGSHGTTIEKIIRHEYFLQVSRSTIKRAVVSLKIRGYINAGINLNDRREMTLTYNNLKTTEK